MSKDVKEQLVPDGEDQYLFGYNDAERMEKIKAGLALKFYNFPGTDNYHPEYVRGFRDYMNNNNLFQPIGQTTNVTTLSQKDLNNFINWLKTNHGK